MQKPQFTTASQIIQDYENYLNALAFIKEFTARVGAEFIDLGNAVGFYSDALNVYLSQQEISTIDFNYAHIEELLNNGIDNLPEDNPLSILKAKNKEILIAAKEYWLLNNHLESVGLCTECEEPNSLTKILESDESFYKPKSKYLLHHIELCRESDHLNSDDTGFSMLMSLDNGSNIEQEALDIWTLRAYLLHENDVIGTLTADLATTVYKLDSQSFFLAMDEDSSFLMEQAHGILSNYLKNPETPHNTIDELYSGTNPDGFGYFSTLHAYQMEINEEYRGKKLAYVMFETIAEMITNSSVLNTEQAIDGGFTHECDLLDIKDFMDMNDFEDYYINANTNGISLISIDASVDRFIERESREEPPTQENINLAVEKAEKVQKYFNAFSYDMSPLGIDDEAPLTVFCNVVPALEHETEMALLGTYLKDPDTAENIGPFNPEYQTKVS